MEEHTDAELITHLILLEQEVGELKSEKLPEYMLPHNLVRILRLMPWRFDQPQS
jgi:hypothetical protein